MSAPIEPVSALHEILPLLGECDLPVSDLVASQLPLFFGMRSGSGLVAVIGLEVFGPVALLRSLAVAPAAVLATNWSPLSSVMPPVAASRRFFC